MTNPAEILPVEDDAFEFDALMSRRRDANDSQKLIRSILASPMEDGPIFEPTGKISFKKLVSLNTDIQTKILTRVAYQAVAGDIKSAEFLFKYGGLEPPKEQNITIQPPTFIDDMTVNITPEEMTRELLTGGEPDDPEETDDYESNLPIVIDPNEDDY